MATVFCSNSGSNTSPYDTWAKAATSLQTAITQASDGDVVVLKYNDVPSGDAEAAADTTYTFDAHCSLVTASADDSGTAYTLTAMGTGTWVGNSTTNRYVRLAGNDFRVYIWGLTIRTAGSTLDQIYIAQTSGAHQVLENCYLWAGNTGSGSTIVLSAATAYCKLIDCTIRLGSTSANIEIGGEAEIVGGSVSSAGSAPTSLFTAASNPGVVRCSGFDVSHVTGNLVANCGAPADFHFDRCKLGAGVTPLVTQTTNPTKASGHVWLFDCTSGDTHGFFGYYDALGQVTTDTGIYFTSGSAAKSWKIVTTANASFRTPFETPPIDVYHTGTSAITPYLEILRDGSTTAYTDAQIWAGFAAKTTSGYTIATEVVDRQAVEAFMKGTTASDQAAGAGTGSWTGEAASAWSGKLAPASAITPAESGSISVVVSFAAASSTVYVDPEIRGLS